MKKAGFLTKIAMATSVSLAFTFTSSFADTIHLKDGSKIEDAAITEIGDSDVKYKIGKRAVIYIAKKSDIATIVYDDGTKEEFASKSNIELDDNKDEELPQPKKIDKKQKQEKIEDAEEAEKGIRFGVRGNVGVANVYPNVIQTTTFFGITHEETIESGVGYGIGGFALIPFWSIYFVPEISIQHRQPVNYDDLVVTETAIDIPLLFRFRYREENLIYLGIGLLFGIVLDLQDNKDGTFKNYRSRSDYGLALELGFRINDNFSIDLRSTVSLASYGIGEYLGIEGETPTLVQGQIGVNYLF